MAGVQTKDGQDLLKVFVSYSRKDIAFADQLVMALEDNGFSPVIDRHDISGGEEWRPRLGRLIIESDAVVFILTDHSATSPICAWEVEEAARLGKRVVPALPERFNGASPASLGDYNRIHFYTDQTISGSGFYDGLKKLIDALGTDHEWVRRQTALTARAAEWEAGGRPDDLLLRGVALQEALAWLAAAPAGAAAPQTVRTYLNASEEGERSRKALAEAQVEERESALREKETLGRKLRRRSLTALASGAVLAGIAVVLGASTLAISAQNADVLSRFFATRAAQASDDNDYAGALLWALNGVPTGGELIPPDTQEARNQVLRARYNSPLRKLIKSPDGLRDLTYVDGGARLIGISDEGLHFYDAESFEQLGAITAEEGIKTFRATADGRRVAWLTTKSEIGVVDTGTGAVLDRFFIPGCAETPDAPICLWATLYMSPDGALVGVDQLQLKMQTWAIENSGRRRLNGDEVQGVIFAYNGKKLVRFDADSSLAEEIRDILTYLRLDRSAVLGVDEDKRQLLFQNAQTEHGTVAILDLDDFSMRPVSDPGRDTLQNLTGDIARGGERVLTVKGTKTVTSWRASEAGYEKAFELDDTEGAFEHTFFSDDGERIVTLSQARGLTVLDADTGLTLLSYAPHEGLTLLGADVSPLKDEILVDASGIHVLDGQRLSAISRRYPPGDTTRQFRIINDRIEVVAFGAGRRSLEISDFATGETLVQNRAALFGGATQFSPNFRVYATPDFFANDIPLVVSNLETGASSRGRFSRILGFSGDDTLVAAVSRNQEYGVWPTAGGAPLFLLDLHSLGLLPDDLEELDTPDEIHALFNADKSYVLFPLKYNVLPATGNDDKDRKEVLGLFVEVASGDVVATVSGRSWTSTISSDGTNKRIFELVAAAFHPHAPVAYAQHGFDLSRIDLKTGATITVDGEYPITNIVADPAGDRILASDNVSVSAFGADSLERLWRKETPAEPTKAMTISHDGAVAALNTETGADLVDMRTGTMLEKFDGALTLSSTTNLAIQVETAGLDGDIRVAGFRLPEATPFLQSSQRDQIATACAYVEKGGLAAYFEGAATEEPVLADRSLDPCRRHGALSAGYYRDLMSRNSRE